MTAVKIVFFFLLSVSVRNASAGRFVTRRRCAASTKPPKARTITLDSSDDFTTGMFGSSRIHQPSRRKRYRPAVQLSSTESSVNTVGASSFTSIPFREISLNESGDHVLGPCARQPIFCSTPSAASFAKQGRSKTFALRGQATSPSVSVSCICVSNTSQEELISPQQPLSSPQSASPSGCLVEGLQLNKEQPLNLSTEPSCSGGDKNPSGDSKASCAVELLTEDLFSADGEVADSNHFVSAAGGLEWLIEALKRKCLSQRCKVQLERLSFLPVTQLCSQTTYSSCLEPSSSVESQQIKELLQFLDSSQNVAFPQSLAETCFSVTNNENSDYVKSASSYDQSASVNGSPSDDSKKSAERSNNKTGIEELKTVTRDSTDKVNMDTKLASSTRVQTRFTDEDAKASKDKSVSKKCSVVLQKMQSPNLHLKGFAQQKEAGDFYETPVNQDTKQPEREGCVVSLRKSKNLSAAKKQCADSEKPSVLTSQLTEERLPPKQFKKALQLKDVSYTASTDESKSASDEQTKVVQESESDDKENTASLKISTRYKRSTCSTTASGQNVEKSHKSGSKRGKSFFVPKEKRRRSVFTQPTGTARKVCVSGMSVSRWKNKGGTLRARAAKMGNVEAEECSISELTSKRHIQPMVRRESPKNP